MPDYDESCRHGNAAPPAMLRELSGSQGGVGRHKCTICAYSRGQEDRQIGWVPRRSEIVACGHGKIARHEAIRQLGGSQAGSGRHKCAVCAYAQGYEYDCYISESGIGHRQKSTSNVLGDLHAPPVGNVGNKARGLRKFTPRKISFKAQKQIGEAGELLVLNTERRKLIEAGKRDLARNVVHIAKDLGDGAGYDILSFNLEGKERYIEVKTTVGPIDTPFYISENERQFSKIAGDSYVLVRVFDFDSESSTGEHYNLSAEDLSKLTFEATSYICRIGIMS